MPEKKEKRKLITEALANRMLKYRLVNQLSREELAEVLDVKTWIVRSVETLKTETMPMSVYIMFKGLEGGGEVSVDKEPDPGPMDIAKAIMESPCRDEAKRAIVPSDFKITSIEAKIDDVNIIITGRKKDVRKVMNKLLAG